MIGVLSCVAAISISEGERSLRDKVNVHTALLSDLLNPTDELNFSSLDRSGETPKPQVEVVSTNLIRKEQQNNTAVCTVYCQVSSSGSSSSFRLYPLSSGTWETVSLLPQIGRRPSC